VSPAGIEVDRLRALPEPDVAVHHLAPAASVIGGTSLFRPVVDPAYGGIAAGILERFALSIQTQVGGGALEVGFAFGPSLGDEAVDALASEVTASLAELLD
jgi:hypothetical protein